MDNTYQEFNPDPRINKLVKIIRWQGNIIVLLIMLIIACIAANYLNIKLPSQKPIDVVPALSPGKVQYTALIYQSSKPLENNAQITGDDNVLVIGQVYDMDIVAKTFKQFDILINDAPIQLNSNSGFIQSVKLKPGSNAIETSYRINGQDYQRRQTIINYKAK